MLLINKIMFYVGMAASVIGTFVGIPLLMLGYQTAGLYLVTILVPFGFLMWFVGFVAFTFLRPDSLRRADDRAHDEAQRYQQQVPD